MINRIQEYLQEKRVFIDDLVAELDDAKSNEEILAAAMKIKGRRSAAEQIFNDLYALTKAEEHK